MDAHVVVLVDSDEDHGAPGVRKLVAQARATGATARSRSADDVISTRATSASEPSPDAVVIGPAVRDPLRIARNLGAAGLECYFVFAADPARLPDLRRQLVYAGPRGGQWSLEAADSPQLVDVIRSGVAAIQRGRQLRSTLDRINARMARSQTIDVNRYRQLLVSDRDLASILKHAQDAIITLTTAGRIRSWNRGAESLFGIAEADALGMPIASLLPGLSQLAQTLEATASGEVVRKELTFAREDQLKHLDAIFTPVEDDADGGAGLTAIIRDVTEHKQAAEALRAADRRKDEFLAVLAHELRNPLAPIRNAIQLMKLPGVGEAERQRSREIAERQVTHMAHLLDDLLDVSRISRGKLTLRAERVALSGALDAAVEAARPALDADDHALSIELPAQPIMLDADPVRLTQIFGNLLNNAAKYSGPGSRISVTAHPQDDGVRVCVKDDGIGIAPDMLSRVFDMFAQLPPGEAQNGIGVGLAITRGLVELHGGRIEAHSEGVGRGSEFIVWLPQGSADERPADRTADDSGAAVVTDRRILVVDDNVDAADSLAMMLRFSGYTVEAVYDGIAALEAMAATGADVVLLDIGMPGMDGHEVARRIRAMPQGKNTLLVALTGWGQQEDRRRTAAAGFDRHVTKPVDPELLMQLVSHDRR